MKWNNIKRVFETAPVLQSVCMLEWRMWLKKQAIRLGKPWERELEGEGTPAGFWGVNYLTASSRSIKGITTQGDSKRKKL